MKEYAARPNPHRCPTHPGELLREDILPAIGFGKSALAQALGISRQHPYDILNERKPVSPEVAVRLGKAFGDGSRAADAGGGLRCVAGRTRGGRQQGQVHPRCLDR